MRSFKLLILLFLITGTVKTQSISRLEYYFDNDPGYGNGIAAAITPGVSVSTGVTLITSALSEGIHKLCFRAKNTASRWSETSASLYYVAGTLTPWTIAGLEYYFDTDPGYGNAVAVNLTASSDVTSGFQVNTAALSSGIHQFCVRVKNEKRQWSQISASLIYIAPRPLKADLVKMEYYFDTDPGYGNATEVIIPSDSDLNEAIPVNTSGLTPGMHKLSVRVENIAGRWSETASQLYYKPEPAPSSDVVNMEYYFDTDPGFGNGTVIPVSQGQQPEALVALNTTSLSLGIHKLCVRAKNSMNRWSTTSMVIYYKQDQTALPITWIEYYFDFDPGFGNGTQVAVTPGNTIAANVSVNTNNLGPGGHILFIRTKDTHGVWSETSNLAFYSYAIRIFVESLYDPATQTMHKTQNETGDQWTGEVADHVLLEFRKHASPHILDHVYELEMRQDGYCYALLQGTYTDDYLVVKHRNGLETWSAVPINTTTQLFYDFTSSVSKAYGDNMININGTGVIYSGDATQDGIIDGSDMAMADNDAAAFSSGYLVSDVNGDGLVDGSDISFIDNNSSAFVGVAAP